MCFDRCKMSHMRTRNVVILSQFIQFKCRNNFVSCHVILLRHFVCFYNVEKTDDYSPEGYPIFFNDRSNRFLYMNGYQNGSNLLMIILKSRCVPGILNRNKVSSKFLD